MKTDLYDDRSVLSLLRRLRDETTQLLRQEVSLAKAEMSEKVSSMGRNVAFLVVGGVVLLAGLMFVLQSISRLIHVGLIEADVGVDVAVWLAPLIVGLIVMIIGYIALKSGRKELGASNLTPERTLESVRRDAQLVKEHVK